jgi:hypothetical protein
LDGPFVTLFKPFHLSVFLSPTLARRPMCVGEAAATSNALGALPRESVLD